MCVSLYIYIYMCVCVFLHVCICGGCGLAAGGRWRTSGRRVGEERTGGRTGGWHAGEPAVGWAVGRAAKARAFANPPSDIGMLILETPEPTRLLVSADRKRQLIQHLEAGGDTMHRAISSLRGSVLKMSFEPFGCQGSIMIPSSHTHTVPTP